MELSDFLVVVIVSILVSFVMIYPLRSTLDRLFSKLSKKVNGGYYEPY